MKRYREDSNHLTYQLSRYEPNVDGTFAIDGARERASGSLMEYVKVVRILTNLVVNGIMPEEDPDSDRTV